MTSSLIEAWHDDPNEFCNDVFHQPAREWQPEIMRAVNENRWTTVAACRELGKSSVAARLAWWFLCTRRKSLVFILAPTWAQIEDSLFAEMRSLWLASELPGIFPTWEVLNSNVKTSDPKWRAIGVAAKDVQNIESRHGDDVLVIIDESKGVPDKFFDSIQGMMSKPGSKILAIGTPGIPVGWFARSFTSERALWGAHFKIRGDEIPRLAKHFESEKARLGENNPWFRQQNCAEFTGADEFSLIPIDAIERASTRDIEPTEAEIASWPKIMSLDPSGRGSDETVLTYRWGPRITKQEVWQGWDEMRTASHVAVRASEFNPQKLIIDEIGVGAGIRARVRQLLEHSSTQVFGYNAGHAPKNRERFMNKKTEHAFALRDMLINDKISIPKDDILIGQMSSWKTDFTATGKTKIVDPDDSPDRADSLLMAFAADSMGKSIKTRNVDWL